VTSDSFDRYCPAYAEPFTISQLFDRAASIDLLKGVDLVLTPDLVDSMDEVKESIKRTGLKVVSVAVDHFTQAKWRQGTFSSVDENIRKEAVDATKKAMDIAVDLDCDLVTIWPGQDGYDYIFQGDYEKERTWFADGVREACMYNKDVKITLEYKIKEPRTHSYVNTIGTTLLMVNEIRQENCGVALDYGHALLGYENPAESIALLKKYGNKLMHVHINDNYRYWDDDMIVGSIHQSEYLEFFYWLRRTGYDGWITIDQVPYREDGRNAVSESAKWLDALESLMDKADMEEIGSVLKEKNAVSASRLMRKLLFK
jgi:xylose isomerase